MKNTIYAAELRKDQWDLICMALEHVRLMSLEALSPYGVDGLGRKFMRRCIDETVRDIGAQVPKE